MSEILGNIYDRSIITVLETVFFRVFLEIVEIYFLTKKSLKFIFIKKTADLVPKKLT